MDAAWEDILARYPNGVTIQYGGLRDWGFGRDSLYVAYADQSLQAAKVRDAKAYELRGEFALLNFQADNKDESERESA